MNSWQLADLFLFCRGKDKFPPSGKRSPRDCRYLYRMFALKNYPEVLRPQDLDAYLGEGWYRMGQSIFTTHFLFFDDEIYSAVWVRLPLRQFQFSKSNRKLIRRTEERFRCVIGPAVIDEEREELYQLYRDDFPGMIAPSLSDSLLDGEEANIYNTYEVAIYDDERLIALSYFDLGATALASIQGVYHPDYKKFSLGFYTLLAEIQFGIELGFAYFYPGYVVPGYPRFDYKLRIGPVEYYDLRRPGWLPYQQLAEKDIPIRKMTQKLQDLLPVLQEAGVGALLRYYPLFEANLFGFWRIPFFDYPVLLYAGPGFEPSTHLVVVFDPRTQLYQLLRCINFEDVRFYFNEQYLHSLQDERFLLQIMTIDRVLETSVNPGTICKALVEERQQVSGR